MEMLKKCGNIPGPFSHEGFIALELCPKAGLTSTAYFHLKNYLQQIFTAVSYWTDLAYQQRLFSLGQEKRYKVITWDWLKNGSSFTFLSFY
uniref:Uncharacterized protein n=1 Tax=Pyxicephalus adspersus TaxID=30357 RepID=A0AAV2ZNG3_PYXAD|nr:TPA: hypothetical protein GDO54_003378 [Pyxicephalus adspersus]